MCGILFAINKSSVEIKTKSRFKKSLSLISHRGPSTSTSKIGENYLIGFNRLSIVDSNNGFQPFYSEDKSIILLCNGEIYNHKELKKNLTKKHVFQGKSDCEIILHLYEEKGEKSVSDLRGQFAFILVDKKKNILLMARDRFGIQPLFYAKNSKETLIVSSEIKSLLAIDSTVSTHLDPIGIKESIFLYGPTPPRTAFKHIFQVKPGHTLIYDFNNAKFHQENRYWKLPIEEEPNDKTVQKTFNILLETAVKRRFQGNENDLGVYLSGGLDSASVLALVKKYSKVNPTSFCIEFSDKKFDESKYQKMIVKHLNTKRHAVRVLNKLDNNLFQSIWHIEQPLIRTAPLPMFTLSKLVHKYNKKFVLCGEGADETMFGYPVFQKNLSSIEDKLKDYTSLEPIFAYDEKTGKELVDETIDAIIKEFPVNLDSVREKQLTEMVTKLSRYLLVSQGDRQSMSHSVEQRFPFLDEDLVDFLFTLPTNYLMNNESGKLLLKNAMKKLLPSEIINRKKQGYLAPISDTLYCSQSINNLINKLILTQWNPRYDEYFNKGEVLKLIDKYQKKLLSDIESIGLFFVISTLILDDQHFS